MAQKTKTAKSKPKNEAKTEKTTVADKMPTAGQRAVRTLAIIGVAAACGLSVCAPLLCSPRSTRTALAHRSTLRLHTFCIVQLLAVFGTGLTVHLHAHHMTD